MKYHLNQQIKTTASRPGGLATETVAGDRALSSSTKTTAKAGPAAASSAAAKAIRLDRVAWRAKTIAIGKVSRADTTLELKSLMLPAILPAVRRDVHKAISQYQTEPADLLELLFQDVSLATSVLSAAQFVKQHKTPKNAKSNSKQLKQHVLTDAIERITLEKICETLDDVEMDAAAMTKLNEPWLVQWWRHAVAVSQLSGELAVALEVNVDLARMAGFFHDIGRLMLLSSNLGSKLISAYEYCPQMDIPTAYAEQALLGMDHHQAGAAYCTRWKLPLAIHNICGQHDLDNTMREQLDDASQRLSAVVSAANEIAKAIGFGSLPDDELRPLPQSMQAAATELSCSIEQCVAQLQTMCNWRTGNRGVAAIAPDTRLDGKLVALISQNASPWHPYAQLLTRAGANVTSYTDMKQVTLNCPMSDVMILDFTDSSLHLAMPVLSRMIKASCFDSIPKLLLANAAEEPHTRIKQSGLKMSVLPTPIRCQSMLKKVRSLLA